MASVRISLAVLLLAGVVMFVRGGEVVVPVVDTVRAVVVDSVSRGETVRKAVSVPKPKTNWSRIKELFM